MISDQFDWERKYSGGKCICYSIVSRCNSFSMDVESLPVYVCFNDCQKATKINKNECKDSNPAT